MSAYGAEPVGAADMGLDALRGALLAVLRASGPPGRQSSAGHEHRFDVLVTQVHDAGAGSIRSRSGDRLTGAATVGGGEVTTPSPGRDDQPPDPEGERVVALVRLAQEGDADAFGLLYDRYVESIYRFCYHRVSSVPLAEDLTSETFFRALRSIGSFRWQGHGFGAWLTTIARNLVTDHYKSSRSRLEMVCDELPEQDDAWPGPEEEALTHLTNEALGRSLRLLPPEQRDCLVLRFLQGLSIAETADVLDRSTGAIKQLQLRAVRNLARSLPRDLR